MERVKCISTEPNQYLAIFRNISSRSCIYTILWQSTPGLFTNNNSEIERTEIHCRKIKFEIFPILASLSLTLCALWVAILF